MSFEIRYIVGNLDTFFRRDEMSVLLYYAKNINDTLAGNFHYLLQDETVYKIRNNISIGNLNSFDDRPAYFNINEIQNCIQFINNQLVPSMQNESVNMWEKYGGFETMKNLINNAPNNQWSFDLNINHDYVPEDMDYYIDMAIEIKELLQESLNLNTPIIISYLD
ncbi:MULTISPECIES: hypothetical protein [unclassified Flavobacterium]|uniref:hypothetical protein n=1 Tax=unclassified Flavobacterium TaxID=196869 RepID=UPI00131C0EBF|nr:MULTISPECIES: hypothetical protein [unclassified Flavobacterium]